jgi:hypothetical protein
MDSIDEHDIVVTPADMQVRMRYIDYKINPNTPYQYNFQGMYGTCSNYSSQRYDIRHVGNDYEFVYSDDGYELVNYHKLVTATSYVKKTRRLESDLETNNEPTGESVFTHDGEERSIYRLIVDDNGIWKWCRTNKQASYFVGNEHHVITNLVGKDKFIIDPTIEQFNKDVYDYELILMTEHEMTEESKDIMNSRMCRYNTWLIRKHTERRNSRNTRIMRDLWQENQELKQRIQVLESEKRTVRF